MSFAIFFSPSEDKISTNTNEYNNTNNAFLKDLWMGEILYKHRELINNTYKDTMQQILQHSDRKLLQNIYGSKTLNAKVEFNINMCINQHTLMPAIERYSGTGFKGLDFATLDEYAKIFIFDHVYIFSNLFGIISAKDKIPYYKLKQLSIHPILSLNNVYAPFMEISKYFDNMDFIIDLRASVYKDLYKPNKYITCEFIKNNKTLSHYSKLYRGKILRYLAMNKEFHNNIDYDLAISIIENIKDMQHIHTKRSNNITTICLGVI